MTDGLDFICKACEAVLVDDEKSESWCNKCFNPVKVLINLFMSDHRKYYNEIQAAAKREAIWLKNYK